MPGCTDCKYYDHKLDFVVDKFESVRNCQIGKNYEMIKWWSENGHKTDRSSLTHLSCHDYHDSTKMLNDLNNSASRLLRHLKISNKKAKFEKVINKI